MLRLIKEAEFDRTIDFAYGLALDPARSGYPTYCDGMKTREDFVSRTRKALERPGEDVLLFEEGGEAEDTGWLEGQGILCNERSWNFLLNLDGYAPLPEPDRVKRVGVENFEEFAAVHRQIQGDMFWNCERPCRRVDLWKNSI